MSLSFRVPFVSDEEIKARAEEFLKKHDPSGTIPVPIEEIVEFQLGIHIVPLHGLHQAFEIDGFTSSDLTEISVDMAVFETRPRRYRFTLAHEIGHRVLHKELFLGQKFQNVDEWKTFIKNTPLKEHGFLESQANKFAGAVLMPLVPLREKFEIAKAEIEKAGLSFKNLPDYGWDILCQNLARHFDVSSDAIRIRIEVEGLKFGGHNT